MGGRICRQPAIGTRAKLPLGQVTGAEVSQKAARADYRDGSFIRMNRILRITRIDHSRVFASGGVGLVVFGGFSAQS